ncbi:MAG: site-specific DNA-methyltransferase [Desulfurellales bacterium]|nr:MAG: site-specific DNA-methyltransferase [Desulfurellales bacterium]
MVNARGGVDRVGSLAGMVLAFSEGESDLHRRQCRFILVDGTCACPELGQQRYRADDAVRNVIVLVQDAVALDDWLANPTKEAFERFQSLVESSGEAGRAIKHSYFQRGELSNNWKVSRGPFVQTAGHNASFPLDLARKAIVNFSPETGIVYDPFAGLGSTLIAAHQLKRRWIGSEISSEYVAI